MVNDGVNGLQQLGSDQPLSNVPYVNNSLSPASANLVGDLAIGVCCIISEINSSELVTQLSELAGKISVGILILIHYHQKKYRN